RLRGQPYVDPKEPVTADELSRAEAAQKISVGEGDILLVSVGRDAHRTECPPRAGEAPSLGGLAPDCIPWLHGRRIAVLGSDTVHDPVPATPAIEGWPVPIHMCGLAAMGLHLLDNLHLADLRSEEHTSELQSLAYLV